ncbi:MAG: hypothetical protein ACMXYD_01560 [Candidatus Woesearchaeota archaeon]
MKNTLDTFLLAHKTACRNALFTCEDNSSVEVYAHDSKQPEPYDSSLYESANSTAQRVDSMLYYGL